MGEQPSIRPPSMGTLRWFGSCWARGATPTRRIRYTTAYKPSDLKEQGVKRLLFFFSCVFFVFFVVVVFFFL